MTFAMVKVLPDPVTPRRVWYLLSDFILFTISFIDLGVMLFFVSFVSLYIPFGGRYVLYVLGILLVIHFIIKIIAGAFQLFSFEGSALYRFFLYLCTLEILPILVLIKYLSTIIV